MSEKNNILKLKLVELQGKIETIKKLEREKGENFNLFSILGMERLEVKTHSSFIFELINPKGSHSQGSLYAKTFVKEVLKIDNFDFKNAVVKREDYYEKEGRIDFTIENENTFIAIEMKIDASDQKDQLKRYKKIAKRKNLNSKLYYLTLYGSDASEISIESQDKKNGKQKKDYENLSFSLNILNWIERCIEQSALLPTVRESLVQYANLIRELTEQISKEITMEVEKMINNPEIAEAATKMAQNIGLVWAKREALFWVSLGKKLEDELEGTFWDIIKEENDVFFNDYNEWNEVEIISKRIFDRRKKSNKDIEFQFYAKINDIEITLSLYQYNHQHTLMYYLYEIDSIDKEDFDELAKQIDLKWKVKGDRYGSSKVAINFFGFGISESEPTYELFDDNKLEEFAKEANQDVLKKLRKIDDFFQDKK